jgi:hypothetical protein
MDAAMPFIFSTLLDSILILGGHGDSITGNPTSTGGSGSESDGGIGIGPIVGVLLLAVVVVGILVWLNREEKETGGEVAVRTPGPRAIVPAGLIAAVIATPLIVWTASSGGDNEKSLIVERWTNDKGAPELIVSLTEEELNTLSTTNGKRTVRLRCIGRQGQAVLEANPKWPFITEAGYDYPHVHQAATSEQVQRADECLLRGARVRLEADVEGALTG